LRIAQVAPPFERVPPRRYGGTERVVSVLTEELVRRGHEVTLFAPGDSITTARLVPIVDVALWHREPRYRDLAPFWSVALGQLYRRLGEFDVVHSHLDVFGLPSSRVAPCPVVTTLHGRMDLPELVPVFAEFADAPVVSISDAQRRPLPGANWVGTVHNGIDLDEFSFRASPGSYLAFLGRISPEKGLDAAIRVACQAGVPIKIAAREPLPFIEDPNVRVDQDYYDQVIKPLFREPGVEFVGELAGRERSEFLAGAAGLLFPIQWPEPFGLVMAEALACGTPVVALGAGSVPEVVDDGATGFVCASEGDMVEAVAKLDRIDRAECRATAVRRYSAAAMADGYERVYHRLLKEKGEADPAREPMLGGPASTLGAPASTLAGARSV
jgi:glycosyltransferase involved in cell wall biosynthesis